MVTIQAKVEKTCVVCGRKYFISQYDNNRNSHTKYCTQKCMGIGRTKRIEVDCQICGKKFSVIQSKIDNNRGKFCGKECKNIAHSKNNSGENNFRYQGGDVYKKCDFCGEDFKVKRYDYNRGYGKFCSHECHGKWKTINNVGDKNPHWKGGVTADNMAIRESLQYMKWKQDVFINGKFTCVKCGQVGGKLHAHHIKKFSVLMEEVKKYLPLFVVRYAASIYKPLWDTNNGIVLCEKCHHNAHRKH